MGCAGAAAGCCPWPVPLPTQRPNCSWLSFVPAAPTVAFPATRCCITSARSSSPCSLNALSHWQHKFAGLEPHTHKLANHALADRHGHGSQSGHHAGRLRDLLLHPAAAHIPRARRSRVHLVSQQGLLRAVPWCCWVLGGGRDPHGCSLVRGQGVMCGGSSGTAPAPITHPAFVSRCLHPFNQD